MKRLIFLAIFALFLPQSVFAATAGLSGPTQVQAGRTFQVRMNIGGAKDVDTVRFVGSFPTDLLEYQGMANGSALPTRSPGSGASGGSFNFGGFSLGNPVNGGTAAGTLTFKALKPGTATISLVAGTRILSAGEDQLTGRGSLTITITEAPAPGEIPVAPPDVIELSSSSHQDQNSWYPSRDLILNWKITGRTPQAVYIGFDQAPEGPAEARQSTATSATFKAPADGVWYGHLVVRYSSTDIVRRDFRFLADRTAPREFSAVTDYSELRSGTPNYLRYTALDDTSGIEKYEIKINGTYATTTLMQTLELTDFAPGTYRVDISAFDLAGNRSDGSTEFSVSERASAVLSPTPAEPWLETVLRWMLWIFGIILAFFFGWVIAIHRRKKKRLRS